MSHGRRLALLGLVPLAILLLGLVLFRDILLPFLVGMAAAYLLDPAADRLQRLGLGRTVATLAITVGFVIVLLVVLLAHPAAARDPGGGARGRSAGLSGAAARAASCRGSRGVVARTELADSVTTDGLIERFSGQGDEVPGHGALGGAAVGAVLAQPGLADLRHAGRDLLSDPRLGPHGGADLRDA